jgi:hypothetical protein
MATTLYRRAAFWAPPATEQYARVKPWVLKSADQFRPGPPPQLSSERYGRDFNETKNMGGIRSTARTPDFFSRPVWFTNTFPHGWISRLA